jgi:hypothetical protein
MHTWRGQIGVRWAPSFVKKDGAWLFAERRLYVDWLEERALS